MCFASGRCANQTSCGPLQTWFKRAASVFLLLKVRDRALLCSTLFFVPPDASGWPCSFLCSAFSPSTVLCSCAEPLCQEKTAFVACRFPCFACVPQRRPATQPCHFGLHILDRHPNKPCICYMQTTVIRLTSLEVVASLRFSGLCTAIGLLSASRTFAIYSNSGVPGQEHARFDRHAGMTPDGRPLAGSQCVPRGAIVEATGTILPLLHVYIQSLLRAEGEVNLPWYPSSHYVAQLTPRMWKVQVAPRCTTADAAALIGHLNLLSEWCVSPVATLTLSAHKHLCGHKPVVQRQVGCPSYLPLHHGKASAVPNLHQAHAAVSGNLLLARPSELAHVIQRSPLFTMLEALEAPL